MTVKEEIQERVKVFMKAFPGISNKLLAEKTGYSERTVCRYRRRIIAEWMNAGKDAGK